LFLNDVTPSLSEFLNCENDISTPELLLRRLKNLKKNSSFVEIYQLYKCSYFKTKKTPTTIDTSKIGIPKPSPNLTA
jgi:hypothetical protein